jgi:hypothetical protein
MADDKFRVLAEINRRAKEKPVLVGGGAVEFYSFGQFVTGDLDLCAQTAALASILEEMGFCREGMYFVRGKLFIHVLGPGFKGRSDEVSVGEGLKIRVISLEDLIIDRLDSCKFWKYAIDCEQARYLLNTYPNRLDNAYLDERAVQDDVRDTLDDLRAQIGPARPKRKRTRQPRS